MMLLHRMGHVAGLTCALALGITVSVALASEQRAASASDQEGRAEPLVFAGDGSTLYGKWHADVSVDHDAWYPNQAIRVEVTFRFADTHLAGLASAGIKADKLCLLVTAERTFDADGWMRLSSDERMSTLLTPTGLAIEGGVQGAITDRYGYQYRSPLDQLLTIPATQTEDGGLPGARLATFSMRTPLPGNLPPGLYRLRFDFGVMAGTRVYNFSGYTFAARPFSTEEGNDTYFYSPIIPASGTHASGRAIDAARIQARFPWLLLSNYNSNGYRGVVADEDAGRFATSDRSLIPDDVILPMYSDTGSRLSYSLEPQFPADTIDPLGNIPWEWGNGELSVRVLGPDGGIVDLGTKRFVGKSGNGPTTKVSGFTGWRPSTYGRYTVTATGWIADQTGRRYEGGGTYHFWIAKRMTLATATFQGMPYPVGSSYGRDIQFNPAVPADVQVTAWLYLNSEVANVRTLSYSGKASTAGIFGAAQGMKSFPLSAPGEYHAHVLATYTDPEGHLWVCGMRHAGVVYAETSPVIARGKKILIGGKYVERGEKRLEGYIEPNGVQHLDHITFPYLAGDVLLIAAEGQGANKIEPVLTYQMQGDASAWDTRLNGVGTTNLRINTSNGYSPHLYPEYITDLEYYYGAAPRPGFMGRFIVGESNVRAPYWPVSPNSFGGQIGASPNGDAPGDIYRLLGAVVLRRVGQDPMYAGYMASAFLLPAGTNNNRVVAAGAEDLNGPTGEKARFFLVGLRPGTAYEVGGAFRPAVQIDPLLPVSIHFVLTYPDGRQQVADGVGDRFGSFAGPAAWPLDIPGVYRYELRAVWNGFQGRMPGLPESGGEFYVYSRTRPTGMPGLQVDGATQRTFSATSGLTITGSSGAASVHYALITPGAVIEQGDLPVQSGKFRYVFDPVAVHKKVPLYDIVSITTGAPQIGRVIHLTFFSEERSTAGASFFDVARVILRGTTAISARAPIPSALATANGSVSGQTGVARADISADSVRISAVDRDGLRTWDARIDRLLRDGDLQLVRRERDTVLTARTHERMQQLYKGIPVFGGEVTRQTENGVTVSVFGALYADIDLDPAPVLAADDAQAVVERRTGAWVSAGSPPTLVVLPLDVGGYSLAWHIEARSEIDVRACFVDATTGEVVLDYSNLKAQQPVQGTGTGVLGDDKPLSLSGLAGAYAAVDRLRAATITTFDLGGNVARAAGAVSGKTSLGSADIARAASTAWTDGATVDAHAYAAATYDYYLTRFGRRGLDGHDGPIATAVHPVRREDWGRLLSRYRLYYTNAFWDGHMAVFGEGLPPGVTMGGRSWNYLSAAVDVVAHELTHAVTDFSAGLVYRNESGALNEAFSDIMATAVEFFVQPAGSGAMKADYLAGEDAVSGGGFRSLENPAASGLPDHYAARYMGTADNGGVGTNSAIVSHAYYLAIEGGTNRTSGLAVVGVGRANREQMEKAFYRAFVYLLPANASFATARAATVQAAVDLYGTGSAAEQAVTQAWAAVGVE
jgi:Zn-dependent metalloprotease